MSEPTCVDDLEKLARKVLDKNFYRFYSAGSDEEITLNNNRKAFERILIKSQVLNQSVANVDLSVSLMGGKFEIPMPICLSPSAFHMYAHPKGEAATAEACSKVGTIMILSSFSNISMEEVKKTGVILWQNVYLFNKKEKTFQMVKRAENAGASAIVITCDIPVIGMKRGVPTDREKFGDLLMEKSLPHYANREEKLDCAAGSPAATWDYFKEVCQSTYLPVVAKGILTANDARRALDNGAVAIMVSNHGGRQLDSAPATIDMLSEVTNEVKHECDVYIDGGIRNGNDIYKALALGAKAVFFGRPALWGLAYDGNKGVERVFSMLRNELMTTMKLSGCTQISDITDEKLWPKRHRSHI